MTTAGRRRQNAVFACCDVAQALTLLIDESLLPACDIDMLQNMYQCNYMITNDDIDVVFQALAHVHRRKMMDIIRAKPGAAVGELATHFDVSRISVMQHLAVLERAGLITSRKDGARRRLYINTVPLQEIHDRWTSSYTQDGARRVLDIQNMAETTARKQKDQGND